MLARTSDRADHGNVAIASGVDSGAGPSRRDGSRAACARQFARPDRALGQQPGDDVHQPGRDLDRFAAEGDPRHRVQPVALDAAVIVEIAARLVGQQHRIDVQRVDQPAIEAEMSGSPLHSLPCMPESGRDRRFVNPTAFSRPVSERPETAQRHLRIKR